jgi:hypothetical protein
MYLFCGAILDYDHYYILIRALPLFVAFSLIFKKRIFYEFRGKLCF